MLSDRADVLAPRVVPGPSGARMLARQEARESNARSYPRRLPVAVLRGEGAYVEDVDGNVFVDFLMGAGVLPLGHGHPELLATMAEQMTYLVHGLDFPTPAKEAFVDAQLSMLPAPMRGRTKIHFCGPTGANAVDAAIKLAKTATGRSDVISFRGGYHGTTHLTMALTGTVEHRRPVANLVPGVHFAPYSYCARCPLGLRRSECAVNCATSLETLLGDASGGVPLPAAIILELVQGEGGVVPADREFVQRVRRLSQELDIPLIVDEIQTGCGRTGTWFAFEQYGIEPDIICASKALSGAGSPLSVILYRDVYDVWAPGAHTGTFRGTQLGFAAGAKAIEVIRRDGVLAGVRRRAEVVRRLLGDLTRLPHVHDVRGLGLMWGIELRDPSTGRPSGELARQVQRAALTNGLIVEVGGRDDCVVRLLPPLNVDEDLLERACLVLRRAVEGARSGATPRALSTPGGLPELAGVAGLV